MARGIRVGKDRVQQLMQSHGINARGKRKFVATTASNHGLPVVENLLNREFSPATPNAGWAGDITYVAADEGWLYLAVVIDLLTIFTGYRLPAPDRPVNAPQALTLREP